MRVFIAISVPEAIKEYLFTLRDSIAIDGRVKKTFDTHITLKFLGEVSDSSISTIIEYLNKISFSAFYVCLDSFGFFPNERSIKVWWVGIRPEEQLKKLQKEIDFSLDSYFKPEENYKPHLTLARIGFINNHPEFLEKVKKTTVEPKNIIISSFSLFKSTLTSKGPCYTIIADFRANS